MTDDILKGLPCYVYRSLLGDATLGGLSSTHDSLLVIGIEGYETVEEADELGRAIFVLDRSDPNNLKVVPFPIDYPRGRFAWGGNFVHACDSRFAKVSKHPIPIHDRDMTKERRF
jgi:hypothetical protein